MCIPYTSCPPGPRHPQPQPSGPAGVLPMSPRFDPLLLRGSTAPQYAQPGFGANFGRNPYLPDETCPQQRAWHKEQGNVEIYLVMFLTLLSCAASQDLDTVSTLV